MFHVLSALKYVLGRVTGSALAQGFGPCAMGQRERRRIGIVTVIVATLLAPGRFHASSPFISRRVSLFVVVLTFCFWKIWIILLEGILIVHQFVFLSHLIVMLINNGVDREAK